MPDQLQPVTIRGPGFRGLNTQDSQVNEELGWGSVCDNAVFDDANRLAARKGYTRVNSSDALGTDILKVYEFRTGATTTKIISTTGSNIYEGTGTTLTSETGALTPSDGLWKFVTFKDTNEGIVCIGVQDGETPIYWNGGGGTNFANVAYPATGSNVYDGFPINGNEILAAFGRLWVVSQDRTTVAWCKLRQFNSAATDWTGGGYLDVSSVWPDGPDYITALASFNDKLIIFGERNILIYANPYTPDDTATPMTLDTTNQLSGTIAGIGCIARDSVQFTGDDIYFLSHMGVRSLKRSMVTENLPTTDVSYNVRDYLVSYVDSITDFNTVDSAFNDKDGFYLLLMPFNTGANTNSVAFMVDTKVTLPDKTQRITRWPNLIHRTACYDNANETLYFGTGDGFLGRYTGYQDNGVSYSFEYISTWKDFQDSKLKFPKKLAMVMSGGTAYTVNFKWGFDFRDSLFQKTSVINLTDQNTDYYNETTTEWGAQPYSFYDEWQASTAYSEYDIVVPTSGYTPASTTHIYFVDAGDAGTSDSTEPATWPTGAGGTVVDNTVTWTEATISGDSTEWSGISNQSIYTHAHMKSNGQHMRYGWAIEIDGQGASIQRLDLFVKIGRLNRHHQH